MAHRLAWELHDARADPPADPVDLVLCIGASDALGGSVRAPAALAGLVRPGGIVVHGELSSRVPPDAALVSAFGIGPGEILAREASIARMGAAGLEPIAVQAASAAARERDEAGYVAAIAAWAAGHPGDPDRSVFLRRPG